MVSVTCPWNGCIHNGKNNKCKARKVNLSMAMITDGRADALLCDKLELRNESKQLLETFEKFEKWVKESRK